LTLALELPLVVSAQSVKDSRHSERGQVANNSRRHRISSAEGDGLVYCSDLMR
jgi:hypothetical protein